MGVNGRMDVFGGVHKGLRKALFDLALQAGSTDSSRTGEVESLVEKAGEAFHFLEHHSRNEDRFLVPEMEAKSMEEAALMRAEHAGLDAELATLRESLSGLAGSSGRLRDFYLDLNRFIAHYLVHIHEEESVILPAVHARFTDGELAVFPQKSIAATEPQDQERMLAQMFPAMNGGELGEFFAGLRENAPENVVRHVEGIAARVLGESGRKLP